VVVQKTDDRISAGYRRKKLPLRQWPVVRGNPH